MKNRNLIKNKLVNDYYLLEKNVHLQQSPLHYAPLGNFILERIFFLSSINSYNKLLKDYQKLYITWKDTYYEILGIDKSTINSFITNVKITNN